MALRITMDYVPIKKETKNVAFDFLTVGSKKEPVIFFEMSCTPDSEIEEYVIEEGNYGLDHTKDGSLTIKEGTIYNYVYLERLVSFFRSRDFFSSLDNTLYDEYYDHYDDDDNDGYIFSNIYEKVSKEGNYNVLSEKDFNFLKFVFKVFINYAYDFNDGNITIDSFGDISMKDIIRIGLDKKYLEEKDAYRYDDHCIMPNKYTITFFTYIASLKVEGIYKLLEDAEEQWLNDTDYDYDDYGEDE